MPRAPAVPEAVDVHVGERIRTRRRALGMSQKELGGKIGVTFQQLQKYEKGVNRVRSSRLSTVAKALEVPITYFFPADNTKMPKAPDIGSRVDHLKVRLKPCVRELHQLRKLL